MAVPPDSSVRRRLPRSLFGGVASVETWSILGVLVATHVLAVYWRTPLIGAVQQALTTPTAAIHALGVLLTPALALLALDALGGRDAPGPWQHLRALQGVLHNTVALAVAATAAVSIGTWLSPRLTALLLVGMLAWDVVAAGATSVTWRVLSASERLSLPNYFLLPSDRPGSVAVLGLADAVFPSTLAVAASTAGHPRVLVTGTLVGAGLAVPLLRVAVRRYGRLPALPFLNTGALAGYGVAALAATPGW